MLLETLFEDPISVCSPPPGSANVHTGKPAAVHASVSSDLNHERSFSSQALLKSNRAVALTAWRGLCIE